MITVYEIKDRISALSVYLKTKSQEHFLFWQIYNEKLQYEKMLRISEELNISELTNQVKSNYYHQLKDL